MNVYALDYGTYVDLKRTNAEPRPFLDIESFPPEEVPSRVVPFADKRSIDASSWILRSSTSRWRLEASSL